MTIYTRRKAIKFTPAEIRQRIAAIELEYSTAMTAIRARKAKSRKVEDRGLRSVFSIARERIETQRRVAYERLGETTPKNRSQPGERS
ncbi:hypothetical protein EAN04_24560 [Salmonella enterica]|nr:hypothetical protein [Salmonella enterica]